MSTIYGEGFVADRMSSARYIVRTVRGMCLGAGAFVVTDTHNGGDSSPVWFREEAERIAMRLNAEDRAIQAEGTSGVLAVDPVEAAAQVCEDMLPKNDPSDWTEYAKDKHAILTEAARRIRAITVARSHGGEQS